MKKIFILFVVLTISMSGFAQGAKIATPKVFGLMKAGFGASVETGNINFNVNSARVGLTGMRGLSTGDFKYQLQVELNANGKVSLLDAYASYVVGSFEVSLGQQQYRFGTEFNRGPRLNYFINTSFLGSFISSYYKRGVDSPMNIGPRDIGLLVRYFNKTAIPINLMVGLMNGSGINNVSWDNDVNIVARAWLDCNTVLDGFGAAVNYYTGTVMLDRKITMAGVELRYMKDRWIVEGEYASRWLAVESTTDRIDLATVHAIYSQPVEWGAIKIIAPMLRWDYGHNITMASSQNFNGMEKINAQRITGGLTFGFAKELLNCELRFNYEHCLLGDRVSQALGDMFFQNKFIVEFYLAF